MKYKHMAIIVLFLVLVLYSLSTVSAANQTISNTTSGGIDKGIKNTENQGTLTLNPGTYNKANQDTGISINKNIIIKGKGSTNQVIIDAKKQRNIFTIGNNINVTFINITFTNAYTTDSGGAIYNKYDGTIMTFINCTFINNSASYGGAIYNEGTDQSIINCNFINNTVKTGSGGAIYNDCNPNQSIINSTFINNNATNNGGAIYNGGNINQCIIGSTFINNTAKAGSGGAVYNNDDGCNQSIINSTFTNNTACINGGGIYNSGSMIVSGNNMSGNTATNLGNVIYNAGSMGILNLTYLNNSTYDVVSGKNVTIYATLVDDMNNPITGQSIRFYVNGTFVDNVNVIEGYADLIYTAPITTGTVIVTGTYGCIDNYVLNIANGQLKIIKNASSNSTIVAPAGKVGQRSSLSGVVRDNNGNYLSGVHLQVVVIGQTYDVVTNGSGAWSLNITPNVSGNFVVVVSWVGNSTCYGFSNSTVWNVANASSNSTINVPNGKVSQQSTISGVAKDENGNPLCNVQLSVVVNGVSYVVNTNGAGAWSLNITPNVSGNLSVVVFWAGNSSYNGFTNNTVWNVANISTNSSIVVVNGTVGKSTIINGTARDENGNPLGNVQLSVVVNGVSYVVNTDGAGAWSLTYVPNVAGNFDVIVSWVGNATFNGFTNSSVLNVCKATTNSSIVVVNGVVGKPTSINGTARDENGNPLCNVQLNVSVNGQNFLVNTNGVGFWSLTYIPNVAGNFDVIVSWVGNATFNGFTNSSVLSVCKATTNSSINASNGVVGKSTTIGGVVRDENGVVLGNVQLSVVVNGVSYVVNTNGAGFWSLNITPNVSGNLSVVVSWAGNSSYNGFTNNTVWNVVNACTNSSIVVVNGVVGKSTSINGTARDENGNPLCNVQLNVSVNGQNFTVNTNGVGFWSLTYVPNVAGNFDVIVSWVGNATFNGFTNSSVLNVCKATTNSSIVVVNGVVGKPTSINGTARDENGVVLGNVQLSVVVNGVSYVVNTNGAGFWSLNITPNVSGNLSVVVTWIGNSSYIGFTNSTVWNVVNACTNSSIVVVNGVVGKSTSINGTARDENGNPLCNVQLNVSVNGQNFLVNTNGVGFWSLTYIPNVAGNFDVIVSWVGNATFNGFTNSSVLSVCKATTNSSINASNGVVGKSTTIGGVVRDENGVVLCNVQLSVVVNGVSYVVNTNGAGVWSLNITPNVSGNLSVVVSWAGNSSYNGFTNNTVWNVVNACTNSSIVVVNGVVGKSTIINGTARDENGNPLCNVQLNVSVNGQNYTVNTNGVGFWSLTYVPNVAGNFDVIVSWVGNATFNGFTNSSVLNVCKATTNSSIVVVNGVVGKPTSINGTARDENGVVLGNVQLSVVVNGVSYVVNTNGVGFWSLNITPNVSGNLSVVVSWAGNSSYNGFTNNTVWNVVNACTNSSIVVVNGVVGKPTSINGTARDENGNPLCNVQLNVSVNGQNYTVNTNGVGFWSLTYVPNVAGNFDVIVSWVGNATFNGFTNSSVLNVCKATTNSTINAPTGTVGKPITINGMAIDENGNPLANVQLSVVVNGVNYTVNTNINGTWSLNYTPNTSGNFTIQVSYLGNSTHNGFTNSTSFNIGNASSNSTINAPSGKIGQKSTISGVATDENGNPLANIQITVTINGTSYNVNTNGTGAWSLNYTPNVSGNLSVIVSWIGNSTHSGFTNNTVFNVANASSNSTVVAPAGKVGQQSSISGIATENGGNYLINTMIRLINNVKIYNISNDNGDNPLANTQISVTVDGHTYYVTTDSNGMWSLNIIPTTSGNLNVTVSWIGNSTCDGFSNSTVWNVASASSNSTIIVSNGKVREQTSISGVVSDGGGNHLANAQISVTVDGHTYYVTTDSNGIWGLNIIPTTSGNLTVTVSWIGNSTYEGFTNTTIWDVVKITSNSSIIVSNGKVGKSSSISGVVSDGGGNHLANAQISVTVDGHTYYVTTDSNGVWSLNIIPTTSGNLTVTVSWVGNITYNGFTNTTTLKVSKIVVKLNIIENGDGSIIIVANATYNDDDTPVVDYPVDFYLDNEKIGNNRTDNNGISTLTILSNKINNGQHKVKVIVLADNPINNAVAFAEFTKESNKTNDTNKTSNNLIHSAIMKKTGVPLNIVLVLLLTIFGFGIRIKQKK